MTTTNKSALASGDRVKVLDTTNNRKRVGYVRSVGNDGRLHVYMVRWDTMMTFETNGLTGRGRFKLLGRG